MLSDEEIKAIEILKDREYDFDELYSTFRHSFIKPYDKSIDIILELIEKQQKEIEELKDTSNKFYYEWKHLEAEVINNFISKDKIKAKIEVLEKELKEYEKIEECAMKYDSIFQLEIEINILKSLSEKE